MWLILKYACKLLIVLASIICQLVFWSLHMCLCTIEKPDEVNIILFSIFYTRNKVKGHKQLVQSHSQSSIVLGLKLWSVDAFPKDLGSNLCSLPIKDNKYKVLVFILLICCSSFLQLFSSSASLSFLSCSLTVVDLLNRSSLAFKISSFSNLLEVKLFCYLSTFLHV